MKYSLMGSRFMDNVKNDKYYIAKILADVKYLMELTKKYTNEALSQNETALDSVFFRFIQIAENASKLTKEFKQEHNVISWSSINGLRNRIVHDYGHTDLNVIFDTLNCDIPELAQILEECL